VKADERAMEAWRQAFPQDIADDHDFFAQKKAKRRMEKEDIRWRKAFIQRRGKAPVLDHSNFLEDSVILVLQCLLHLVFYLQCRMFYHIVINMSFSLVLLSTFDLILRNFITDSCLWRTIFRYFPRTALYRLQWRTRRRCVLNPIAASCKHDLQRRVLARLWSCS
jgi:hypothetical protein